MKKCIVFIFCLLSLLTLTQCTPAIPSYWGILYNANDGNCTSSGEALDFYIDGVFHATVNSGENLPVKLTAGEHTFRVLLTKTQEVLQSG